MGNDQFKPLYKMTEAEKFDHFLASNLFILRVYFSGRYELSQDGKVAMFREPNRPQVDFYLTTGRWKKVGTPDAHRMISVRDYRGALLRGAEHFILWYEFGGGAE